MRDVEYQRQGDRIFLARVYRPAGTGPFPILLDVHGGVWTSGSRTSDVPVDRALAETGIVVVAIDFRQPPDAGYPSSVADVHLAVRWLKAHAVELGGGSDRIGALGSSTGGHLVLLVALRPHDPRYACLRLEGDLEPEPDLAYAVLCWPIVDPLARYRWARENGNTRLTERHERYWATEDAMAEGNPQRILEEDGVGSAPPLLIVQGTRDENIPCALVERFAETYRGAGGSVQLELYDGEPHNFIKARPDRPGAAQALADMTRFVHEHATR